MAVGPVRGPDVEGYTHVSLCLQGPAGPPGYPGTTGMTGPAVSVSVKLRLQRQTH